MSYRILLLIGLLVSPAIQAESDDPLVQQARSVVGEFSKALKSALQQSMSSGGPVEAIGVCHLEAPLIATKTSKKSGWQVRRTSLKLRNSANAPDPWELAVLEAFEKRKVAGEDPAKLEFSETVDMNGQSTFRYMKAIPTAGVCLACHGDKQSPEVTAKLKKLYPDDQAHGFAVGDLRGAFTLKKPL